MEEIQHFSDDESQDFSDEEHPLMFVEEFENDDEEIQVIVCSGCDQSIYAPAYKCSHCNIYLHKSCAELSPEIRHFSHKEHPMMFVKEFEDEGVCSGCNKSVCAPAYKCFHCNFFLHKSCAELPTQIYHRLHPDHILVLQKPSKSKICVVCRKNCERCFFYHCNSCDFDLDIECASIWGRNTDDGHQHEFATIFQYIHFTCEVCGEHEDGDSYAEVCRICQLLAHFECTWMRRTIKIMADRHLLTFIHSLVKVIKEHHDLLSCDLCCKQINLKYAGYYCQQCDFIAHLKCADENSIGASSDTIDDSNIEEEEGIDFEEGEELEELKHFHHHEHNLFLSRNQVEVHHERKLCEGCVKSISAPFYSCQQCNYFLHSKCARLPKKKWHPKHPHLLTLSARGRRNDVDVLMTCYACNRLSHGFGYMCHECPYSIDIRCSLIPKTFRHEGHQHPLSHAVSYYEKCNACDMPNYNYSGYPVFHAHSGVFVCKECNFALGYECATLPLKAKYEYDPHPLSLTYAAQNDSEEYYCLICEEERNSNHWFYCCIECNFVAHPECVVGSYPYIKYGRTFDHEWHQHPLTFVRRTKDVSRPCDTCGESFGENVGLNCTQCKSFMHFQCTF